MFRFLILLFSLLLPFAARAEPDAELQKALAEGVIPAAIDGDARNELDSFYAARGYRPAWNLSDDEAVKKTLAFLDSVEALVTYHGLNKSQFHIDEMRRLAAGRNDAERPKLELMITESLLHLAHDLHGDAIDLSDFYTGWNFHRAPADIPAQLGAALADGKLEAFFDGLSPQGQPYRELARALADYRALEAKGGFPKFEPGPSLQPASEPGGGNGHNNEPRVGEMRARLAAEGYDAPAPPEGANYFDDGLKKALIDYQNRNGLAPDGHAGARTQEALATSLPARIVQIRANMERWRHMPETFPPDRYAMVNIPDFSVTIVENGREIYKGAVIVGKSDRQTPFIDSRIVNMVVNPPWNVPVSIARKDILPKLRRDPHYLEKLGFVIAGREDDPTGADIDWKHMSDEQFHYQLRQSPGDINSLGRLKFNFANPFDVYMHGTPHQELFEKAERNFSSGCVRLEDPIRVGEILLENNHDKGGWSAQRIGDEIDADKTHWVTLAKPMPIYFLYWSVFVADDGQLNFRKDIYDYDSDLMEELKKNAS